jgi:predicted alpha/beta hydrolase family esterase
VILVLQLEEELLNIKVIGKTSFVSGEFLDRSLVYYRYMKKVFIVHGFMGTPNGGWKPWLMKELDTLGVYACSLPMPTPDEPKCREWVEEISRNMQAETEDIILIGHSLGCIAILNYLETVVSDKKFGEVFFVSGPAEKLHSDNPNSKLRKMDDFYTHQFNYQKIKNIAKKFIVIHGDDDNRVPFSHAEKNAKELEGELVIIKNGGHLSGWNGFTEFPQLL